MPISEAPGTRRGEGGPGAGALARAIASVGGVGLCPVASATVGSLIALPLAWWAPLRVEGIPLLLAGCAVVVGVWASGRAEGAWGRDDGRIVIDEVIALWIGLLGLPHTPGLLVAGFLLFRALDIWKPGPIRWAQELPGGWGVMADDLVAAAVMNGALRLLVGWGVL